MGEQRFARHELIPGWDQRTLASASVVIVGVGALGTEVARLLAQAGVGRLTLCDPDIVEESNLSRGALFTPGDLGTSKATAAAAVLRAANPDVAVEARVADLRHGVGLAELRDADLVLSCLDSITDRIALAARCALVAADVLDAGTTGWGGELRYFPAGGACYACGCTPAERAVSDWHVACADPPAHQGASAPVSALIAAWQAVYAVRLLFGLPVAAGAIRVEPASGDSTAVVLPRDPDCPLHQTIDPARVERTELTERSTVAELLERIRPGEQALAWYPTTPGDPFSPLTLADAPAGARLRDLGIPHREILPVVHPTGTVRYLELGGTTPDETP